MNHKIKSKDVEVGEESIGRKDLVDKWKGAGGEVSVIKMCYIDYIFHK